MQTNTVWRKHENYDQGKRHGAELKSMLYWAEGQNQNKSKQKQTHNAWEA